MKNIFSWSSVVFFGIILLTTACDKEEDNSPTNALAGTWVISSGAATGCNDPNDNDTVTFTCDEKNCTRFTFTEDGKVISSGIKNGDKFEVLESTYQVKSNNVIEWCEGSSCEELNFQISGNTLTISSIEDDDAGCSYTNKFIRD